MRHFLILLLFSSILLQKGFAQISPKFQVRHYTTENGLPSNGLKGIQWDEETGFLWIGTEAGVVRFNGIDFKTYSNLNTPFIASERIWALIRNNRGEIYSIDDKQNIMRIQKNNLSLYYKSLKILEHAPHYAVRVSESFLNYKMNNPISEPYPNEYTRQVFPVTDTSMFFISLWKIYALSLSNDIPRIIPTSEKIISGFKIKNDIFFISDKNELFLCSPDGNRIQPVQFSRPGSVGNKPVYYFWESGMEDPIMICGSKAWLLEYDGKGVNTREITNRVPGNILYVHAQYSKEKRILFLGTESKGLIVISENRLEVLKRNQPGISETNAYYSQIELPGNAVLTSEAHVIGHQTLASHSLPIKKKFFFNSYITDDSLLWFIQPIDESNIYYLNCYNYNTNANIVFRKIPVDEKFALTCSNGNTYIALDNGIAVLEKDSLRYLFQKEMEKPFGLGIIDMVELSPGILAVASCQGLIRYNVNEQRSDTLLNFPGNCIRALWKYKDYLFIGTYGKGYYVYKNGKIKAMPMDKNNFLSHVHCFIPDQFGFCWMSTNRGLFKSNLNDLVNAYEKDESRVYYHYFGRSDGMETTELNGGCTPCALQMQNGTISFPSMDGLLWVNPLKSTPILPSGDIFIDEVHVDGKNINVDSLAEDGLPANTREILVQLGYPAWSNKENLYIEYDLNNSGMWKPVNINNDAVIRLYGLASGDYNLRIRKMTGFGANNFSYDQIQFVINTPWYLKWWFFVLFAVFAFAIGRFFVQLRIRQYKIRQLKLEKQVAEKTKELQQKNEILEKNDTIKTRLISIISHDIVTPLKFLSVAGKNLVEKKHLMSEELKDETIGEMTNTSLELQLLSTNILNWIKYQNENRRLAKEIFNVKELVNHVIGVLNSMAHQKQLQLSNQVEDNLELYQFAEPLRILIYNLVSNAINFSEKGSITIRSQQESGNIMISVTDQGIGMSPEQVRNIMGEQIIISARKTDSRQGNGLGYLIIKDLVKMVGGELMIESERGVGTTVSIKLASGREIEETGSQV